jgi:hypothetical protein
VFSIFFLGDIRARYAFDILPESRFTVQVGGGVSVQEAEVSLFEADLSGDVPEPDTDTGDTVHGYGAAPILYMRLGVDFTKHFILYAEGDGFVVGEDKGHDVTAKFKYRINPKWDVALGWRWSEAEFEFSELANEFKADGWAFHAAYSF